MAYNKWDPYKVHFIRGQPIIYNKADKPLSQWDAEQAFKKAVHTMHTWMTRYFRLTVAQPDEELRKYELEHLEWALDNIDTWAGAMRKALEEARDDGRKKETIDKLIALAERTPFPEEADAARRRIAAKRQGGS